MPAFAGDNTGRQLRALPEVVMASLRNGDIEAVMQAVLHALDDGPLFLQRVTAENLEFPGNDANDHGTVWKLTAAARSAQLDFSAAAPASVRATDSTRKHSMV